MEKTYCVEYESCVDGETVKRYYSIKATTDDEAWKKARETGLDILDVWTDE